MSSISYDRTITDDEIQMVGEMKEAMNCSKENETLDEEPTQDENISAIEEPHPWYNSNTVDEVDDENFNVDGVNSNIVKTKCFQCHKIGDVDSSALLHNTDNSVSPGMSKKRPTEKLQLRDSSKLGEDRSELVTDLEHKNFIADRNIKKYKAHSWDNQSTLNVVEIEEIKLFLKTYGATPSGEIQNTSDKKYITTFQWTKGLTEDERTFYLLLRYILRKVRRGMTGIKLGFKVVEAADYLICGLWVIFLRKQVPPLEILECIKINLKNWCVIFEGFHPLKSFQYALSKEKHRAQEGKPRTVSEYHAVTLGQGKGSIASIVTKVTVRTDSDIWNIVEAIELLKLAVEERIKTILSGMYKTAKTRAEFYKEQSRFNMVVKLNEWQETNYNEPDLNGDAYGEFAIENPKNIFPVSEKTVMKKKKVIGVESTKKLLIKRVNEISKISVKRKILSDFPFTLGLNCSKNAELSYAPGIEYCGIDENCTFDSFIPKLIITVQDAVDFLVHERIHSNVEMVDKWRHYYENKISRDLARQS